MNNIHVWPVELDAHHATEQIECLPERFVFKDGFPGSGTNFLCNEWVVDDHARDDLINRELTVLGHTVLFVEKLE